LPNWSQLSSEEIGAAAADPGAVALVPLGAIEQHGRHLPVDVDVHAATAVAEAVAGRDPRVLVAPAIPWGFSASHAAFPGTITLAAETLLGLLRDVCGSLLDSGFRTVLVVNGHNGNMWVAGQVAAELAARPGSFVGAVSYFDLALDVFKEERRTGLGGEGHAGELETSIELFLRPELVGAQRDARPIVRVGSAGFADLADRGVVAQGFDLERDYPEGVMGDPGPATAELGERIFSTAVERLGVLVRELGDRPTTPDITE
jgi:creatinine amidohydrolase